MTGLVGTIDSFTTGISLSRSLFAEEEAEIDIEDVGSEALLGVLFPVATALLVTLLQ